LPIAAKVFLTSLDFINLDINPSILEPPFATVLAAFSAKSAIPVFFKKLHSFTLSHVELRVFPAHDPTFSPIDIKPFAVLNKLVGIPSSEILNATLFIVPIMASLYNLDASPDWKNSTTLLATGTM
jgi:hypothetical protein